MGVPLIVRVKPEPDVLWRFSRQAVTLSAS